MTTIICPHCNQPHAATARFCPVTGRLIGSGPQGPVIAQPQNQSQANPVAVPVNNYPLMGGYPQAPAVHGVPTGMLPANSYLNNRYIVLNRVGQGGMAAVYRAVDTRTNAVLAIKEMSDSAATTQEQHNYNVASFMREANLLATLSHPNLPRVSDVFFENQKHYLVMEFVEGQTLTQALKQRGHPFDEATVVSWAVQLCSALTYLHGHNPPIIFRDMKPDNVMVTPTGQIKLIDFGIVRFFKPGQRKDTLALGTEGYVAPEAAGGQTDARSDVYSLCATMYHLLTGIDPASSPFNLPPARQVNPAISTDMEQALMRGLKNNPFERFPSAQEMSDCLCHLNLFSMINQGVGAGQGFGMGTGPGSTVSAGGGQVGVRTSRPTTRLLMAAVKLNPKQIVIGMVGAVAALVLFAWVLTPLMQQVGIDWNIFPIFALFVSMAYSAYPHRGVAIAAHAVLTTALIETISLRTSLWFTPAELLTGIAVSGLLVEVWLALLPRVKGKGGQDAWKTELAWYAGIGAPFVLLFFYLIGHGRVGMNPLTWLFGAVFTALGWFLGDMVHQYLLYRQTGLKWKP